MSSTTTEGLDRFAYPCYSSSLLAEETGMKKGSKVTHQLIVCDTYDYEDYIVIVHEGEDLEAKKVRYNGVNMQRIHEVRTFDPPVECHHWTCSHDI
jgi:hypothetical protein